MRNNKWFKATNSDGKVYMSKNQKEFAREHNLYQSLLWECLHKKARTHKGWTFEYLTEEEATIQQQNYKFGMETI
jgi:hypothetical protein